MFLTQENLLTKFRQRLESAQEIDIATAWATSGPALEALEKARTQHGICLRVIVGTSGNATEPEALERLNEIGQIRLAGGSDPMFHPKVYIFREQESEKSVAWVGSANFTGAGFGINEETVFETGDVKSIVDWFNRRWKKCKEVKPTDIEDYRKRREEHPPSKDMKRLVYLSSQSDAWKTLDSFERVQATPYPTKIRFQGKDIDCEWAESGGKAWGKMFVCLADWLVQERRMTKDDCPVEISGGNEPFPCIHTDRDEMLKRLRERDRGKGWGKDSQQWTEGKLKKISNEMWVAVPRTQAERAKRAKQLLEKFHVSPNDVELLMSE